MSHHCDLSFQDYRQAQRLYLRTRKSARIRSYLWFYCLPIVAVCLVVVDVYARHLRPSDMPDQWLAPTFFFVWMSIWVVAIRPWHLRRCFKKSLPPGETKLIPMDFSFDDQGVVAAHPGRSEVRFFWNAIIDSAEDENTTLLFVAKKRFIYVPRRTMDDEVRAQLQSALQEHGIPLAR